jgi:hypothetical protein
MSTNKAQQPNPSNEQANPEATEQGEAFKLVQKKPPPEAQPDDPYAFGRDKVLAYAWELYETYSKGSQDQKENNSKIRQQVIWLIFATSVLAVATNLPGVNALFRSATVTAAAIVGLLPAAWAPVITPVFNFLFGGNTQIISVTLIILSVATTSLLNYASQFTPLKAWIMYRAGADRIRSEIYLYRMHAGTYVKMGDDPDNLRGRFLEQIEAINKQIYELETAPPFLQLAGGGTQRYRISNPRYIWQWVLAPFRFKRPRREFTVATISVEEQRGKKRLPGRYYAEHDDGFNSLTTDAYLKYRVVPQRDWYVKKVYEDYEKIKDWRSVLLIMGGASAVLAAVSLEPWIVVSTAAVVAINTHLQLNLVGSTYGTYHLTASRLDSAIVKWENMPESARQNQSEISNFVNTIEGILEDERSVWIQQASQAQKESEQSLIKGAGKRDGLPSLDLSYIDDSYKKVDSSANVTADGVVQHKPDDTKQGGGAATPPAAANRTSNSEASSATHTDAKPTTTADSSGPPPNPAG